MGPKDDMPMLTLTSKDDSGNDSTMGVSVSSHRPE